MKLYVGTFDNGLQVRELAESRDDAIRMMNTFAHEGAYEQDGQIETCYEYTIGWFENTLDAIETIPELLHADWEEKLREQLVSAEQIVCEWRRVC